MTMERQKGDQEVPETTPLTARVAHASPGRIRLKLPRESFGTPELAEAESQLAE